MSPLPHWSLDSQLMFVAAHYRNTRLPLSIGFRVDLLQF